MIFLSDVQRFFDLTKNRKKANFITMLIYFFHPKLMPIALYRISYFLNAKKMKLLAHMFSILNQYLYDLEISPKVKIGKGLFLPHCRATVIGAIDIGENVTIYQNVTLGAKFLDFEYSAKARPTIGNEVVIGTGATILGPIKIGNHVKIGPHILVVEDVADGLTLKSIPNEYIAYKNKTNPFI